MLETGLIVGGWDKYEGGQIYSVPLGGTILRQPFAIGGSGSTYLYAFFDQAWKEGMSKDEAEKFVVKAVSLAMARDGASGGVVRTVIITRGMPSTSTGSARSSPRPPPLASSGPICRPWTIFGPPSVSDRELSWRPDRCPLPRPPPAKRFPAHPSPLS